MEWLNTEIVAGNTLQQICIFFVCILVGWILGRLLKAGMKVASKSIDAKRPLVAVGLDAAASPLLVLLILIGMRIGFLFLDLGEAGGPTESLVQTLIEILFTLAITWLIYNLVEVPNWIFTRFAEKSESRLDDMLAPIVRKSLRLTISILGLVQIAQILSGKDVTAIIAGLGVGGLAVALAAQDTIKNFFGSLVIFADKPFELGERINVDNHDGTIEEVGLRSTRLRRLDGHLVTIPNGELANKSIWNIAKRPFIRNLFHIEIPRDSSADKVRRAKEIVEEILKDHEGMNADYPPRVYFQAIEKGLFKLIVIYWYFPPAYWDYMAFTERVNLEIVEKFNAEDIEFALPAQSISLKQDELKTLPEA